jgi:hypothetical protein
MFEKRVMRKFGSLGEGWMCWRKLHNEELHNAYSSQDFIIMVKSVDCILHA